MFMCMSTITHHPNATTVRELIVLVKEHFFWGPCYPRANFDVVIKCKPSRYLQYQYFSMFWSVQTNIFVLKPRAGSKVCLQTINNFRPWLCIAGSDISMKLLRLHIRWGRVIVMIFSVRSATTTSASGAVSTHKGWPAVVTETPTETLTSSRCPVQLESQTGDEENLKAMRLRPPRIHEFSEEGLREMRIDQ